MTNNLLIAIISLTSVIITVNAIPQNGRLRRQNPNENFDFSNANNYDPIDDTQRKTEQQLITDVFDSPPSTPPSMRGAGFVVTPDPSNKPTTSPQILTKNEQNCTCIPYHMCDPRTNTVKNQDSDDEVIGYGKIDIRFDAQDCREVLDVCCLGVTPTDEPLTPVTPPPPKPPQAGCGVRNVGGLDFEVVGAFVSSFLLFSSSSLFK